MEHQSIGFSALDFLIHSTFLLHAAEGWRMRFYSAIRLRSRAGLPWGKAPYPKDMGGYVQCLLPGGAAVATFGRYRAQSVGFMRFHALPNTHFRSRGTSKICCPIWRTAGYFSFYITATRGSIVGSCLKSLISVTGVTIIA